MTAVKVKRPEGLKGLQTRVKYANVAVNQFSDMGALEKAVLVGTDARDVRVAT